MKERPIIMQAESVRAILDGRQTQMRRVVKFEHANEVDKWLNCQGGVWRMGVMGEGGPMANMGVIKCPHGQPGDRLWVKETFSAWTGGQTECGEEWDCIEGPLHNYDPKHGVLRPPTIEYRATRKDAYAGKWRSPMFMPRWASLITIELVNVRVERVQDISEADAKAEGAGGERYIGQGFDACAHREAYRTLWNSIHGKNPARCWEANPWVWVLEFKRVKP